MEYEKETEELEITDELFEAYDHELETYNRGFDIGYEKGFQEGYILQIVENMYKSGIAEEEIYKMSTLPIEEVKSLINKLKMNEGKM